MSKYSPYILFLLICVFVVILAINNVGPISRLQQSVNDFLCRMTASEEMRSSVVLVTVDQPSQNNYGQWPWHYDLVGDLVAAVGHGEPKSVVVDLDLYENAPEDSAGYTKILADQLTWVPNVVLPYDIALATFPSTKTSNPKHLFNHSMIADKSLITTDAEEGLWVRKVFLPADRLLDNNPRLGFDFILPDDDQVVRHQPMAMYYDGYYYPSLPLTAAAGYLGIKPEDIRIGSNGNIELGTHQIPVNQKGELFLSFNQGVPFARYSAGDVLGQNFDFKQLKDKLVIIGFDDAGQSDQFRTPVEAVTPELHITATAAENIINNRFLTVHDRPDSTYLIILLLLGAIGAVVLTHIPLTYRLVVLAGSLVVLANVNYFMVASLQILPHTMYIALQLVLFAIASPLLETSMLSAEALKPASEKKHKPVSDKARARQERASLAAAPVRELKVTPSDPTVQHTTAFDSDGVYEHEKRNIDADVSPDGSRTVASEAHGTMPSPEVTSDSESIVSGFENETPKKANASPSFSDSSRSISGEVEIKNLGRYQISGVLGKGAMGTVYRGIDPAINRPVALKTIRLDFVNDPAELEELKERLYREAQAAGKLSHPNIVTIYDVGSEGPLQYIAMEFLEGQTLENLIRKKVKFNYKIIAQMITQICQALEYAHGAGIVHRDIKPANIMVLADYKVKVMDFGIARIDSNSMTKTGIAMGTPNYISPEQLKGVPIDRRADLFSLGVVMYEMLLGRRPFKGENITSLIYSILHGEPDKPSVVNPQIPLLFDHVIMRALKKVPQERYQKASDIANDLHDFVESFASR